MPHRPLVSISEASRVLGVSEVTLRQWTDEGKIRAFVTPGGHRRYSRAELRQFVGLERRVHGIKDLVAELEEAASLQREIARTSFLTTSWYGKLTEESHECLARCGRQLLNLAIRYITEPPRQQEIVELSRNVGTDFGAELTRLGLPLTDAVEAFLLHRTPVVNAASRLMKKREVLNERAVEAIPLLTHIMDEALLSLVAAYQDDKACLPSADGGGAG